MAESAAACREVKCFRLMDFHLVVDLLCSCQFESLLDEFSSRFPEILLRLSIPSVSRSEIGEIVTYLDSEEKSY